MSRQIRLEQRQYKFEQCQGKTDITLGRLDLGQAAIESRISSENTRIVSGLQEAYRVHSAQIYNIAIDVAYIKGNVIKIEKVKML